MAKKKKLQISENLEYDSNSLVTFVQNGRNFTMLNSFLRAVYYQGSSSSILNSEIGFIQRQLCINDIIDTNNMKDGCSYFESDVGNEMEIIEAMHTYSIVLEVKKRNKKKTKKDAVAQQKETSLKQAVREFDELMKRQSYLTGKREEVKKIIDIPFVKRKSREICDYENLETVNRVYGISDIRQGIAKKMKKIPLDFRSFLWYLTSSKYKINLGEHVRGPVVIDGEVRANNAIGYREGKALEFIVKVSAHAKSRYQEKYVV
jgi:hypothetical protein